MSSRTSRTSDSDPEIQSLQRRVAELELRARTAEEALHTAQAAFEEQRALTDHIIQHDPNAIAVYDNDLRYIYVSQRYLDDYHLEDQDIIGKHHYEVFPEMPQRWKDVHQRVLAGAVESSEDDYFNRANGSTDYNRWECRPWYRANGSIGGMITYTEVTTEQKRAEDSVRASEAKMRSVFRAAPIGIGVIVKRVFLDVNDRFCAMVGYARDELLGRNARMLYPSDAEYEHVGTEKYRQIATTGIGTVETRFRRKDDTIIDVILSSSPFNRDDLNAGVTFTVLDITERKLAEQALRASEARLNEAQRVGSIGNWEFDIDTQQITWSEELFRQFERDPALGPPTYDENMAYYAPEDAQRLQEQVRRAIEHGEEFDDEYQLLLPSGRVNFHRAAIRVARDDTGRVRKLYGVAQDITPQKATEAERDKLEVQLRQAQKMEAIGQLAGGVAHDFNNILTAIFGNVELATCELETHFPDAGDVIEGVRQIERSAKRAADLTRQLLAFSRRQIIRPEVLDLNIALRDLEKMLRRLITEDIALHLHCADGLRYVKADPGQVEQVIVNLAINARDAMPDGGTLTLETQDVTLDEAYAATHPDVSPGSYVLLAVSDTGSGMDSATLERVFEPFFTTKPVGQGTGLGLSTVYGIVRQSGGNVAVYSEPDRGSTFKIYWPAATDTAVDAEHADSTETPPSGTETILICEDDDAVRELTTHVLREAGYTVLSAGRAGDALQLAASEPGRIDLLIADVIMPDMNGRKLADALRSLRPHVRTLFVSGYTSNVIAHHGVLDEGVEFLEKPFSRRQILKRVREVLNRPAS